MRTIVTILLIFLLCRTAAIGQEFSVMFYNTENLFDTVDDTTKNDDEFLPQGERRWTPTRYHKKLNAIASAVAAAGEWELPALIGLCEVENEVVLKDLIYGTILSAGNYGIAHRESPDPRGIDLALLYRRERFRVASVEAWLPATSDSIPVNTRNLLYVKVTGGADTLHLLLCHLPSRRGGVLAAEGLRDRMITLAGSKVDSIMNASEGRAAVIVMGDFNAPPDDELMTALTGGENLLNLSSGLAGQGRSLLNPSSGLAGQGRSLFNLSARLAGQGKGSYRYQGTWEMIDQMLVSPAMLDSTAVYNTEPGSFRVLEAPFLLTEDETYPGMKPFPAYGGYRWAGGYSDHLPVLLKVNQK